VDVSKGKRRKRLLFEARSWEKSGLWVKSMIARIDKEKKRKEFIPGRCFLGKKSKQGACRGPSSPVRRKRKFHRRLFQRGNGFRREPPDNHFGTGEKGERGEYMHKEGTFCT